MRRTMLCPVKCPMGHGRSDATIRGWLASIHWHGPVHVKDGVIWVPDEARGQYLNEMVAEKWVGTSRPPTIGIYEV
jgi:hypothetical protein